MPRTFSKILIVGILAVVLAGGFFAWQWFGEQKGAVGKQSALPATCQNEIEGAPVIISLSSYSGLVGAKFEIRGCNFSGFEGDKNVWIENSQGVKGLLRGEAESTSKLLKITLNSPLCQKDISYSGLPCDAWLNITPGAYQIYTLPWGKKSNEVTFTIK